MKRNERDPKAVDTEFRDKGRSHACGPAELSGFDYERDLGDPGQFPFTRGIHREMYRKRLWTMRQYAGYGTAEDSNRRFKYLLEQGTTGLSVAFDLATQIGLDSDHPLALGEVGRVGVAIDCISDMERLFEDIPLDEVSTSMTINSTAPILLAMYLVLARRQGVSWKKLRGTVQNDILKEYLARGTYIYPPRPSLRLVTDVFEFCSREVPLWNSISVSGYHIREAGATAAQEVAFTLANALTYLEAAREAGMEIDSVAPQVSFFFAAHNDFFEEIAKFRAARRLWARLMRERLGARNPKSMQMRFHVQTAGSTLTAQQPENNVARVALQALSAVLGGAQSLHANSRDEALALPTEESAQLALRTQQVIAHETGVAATADPAGGSWYVEHRTNKIEESASRSIDQIQERGGVLPCLESGYLQIELQEAAYRQHRAVEQGDQTIVGVNRYRETRGSKIQLLKMDERSGRRQLERLREFRTARNSERVEVSLQSLEEGARSNVNLMSLLVECVDNGATVGEMSDRLRNVFGEFKETRAI